jgi:two-component system alkaline phosphatase synthesis response regulator PhoP
VLVVDDEAPIRLICRVNFRSAGLATLEAADGETALALARSKQPDIILLDIMLPAMDGWRVAEELAADSATAEIPVLFLSARSEQADERRAYEAGGIGYVAKPFDPPALAETVSSILERLARGERESLREEWGASLGIEPA